LLTSHYLLDIERLADRVLVLADGAVQVDMGVDQFSRLAGFTATVTVRGRKQPPSRDHFAAAGVAVDTVVESDDMWTARLRVRDWGGGVFGQLSRALESADVMDIDVAPVRLEDVYAHLTTELSRHSGAAPVGGGR
jgi:ABC-2 type transport system ATP-binding protein